MVLKNGKYSLVLLILRSSYYLMHRMLHVYVYYICRNIRESENEKEQSMCISSACVKKESTLLFRQNIPRLVIFVVRKNKKFYKCRNSFRI